MKHVLELKRVVDNINPHNLNMEVWKCGTYMCVAGFCASDLYFQAQGLELYNVTFAEETLPEFRTITYIRLAGTEWDNPLGGSFESLAHLFGITREEAGSLFTAEELDLGDGEAPQLVVVGNTAKEMFKDRLNTLLGYDLWEEKKEK